MTRATCVPMLAEWKVRNVCNGSSSGRLFKHLNGGCAFARPSAYAALVRDYLGYTASLDASRAASNGTGTPLGAHEARCSCYHGCNRCNGSVQRDGDPARRARGACSAAVDAVTTSMVTGVSVVRHPFVVRHTLCLL